MAAPECPLLVLRGFSVDFFSVNLFKVSWLQCFLHRKCNNVDVEDR